MWPSRLCCKSKTKDKRQKKNASEISVRWRVVKNEVTISIFVPSKFKDTAKRIRKKLLILSVIKLVSYVSVLLIPTLPVNLDYVGVHSKEESALD